MRLHLRSAACFGLLTFFLPARSCAAEKSERYFNCGFCARSLKKHKNYEDGVLIVSGRRCILKNMNSATISSALVSFSTDGLQEGSLHSACTHQQRRDQRADSASFVMPLWFVVSPPPSSFYLIGSSEVELGTPIPEEEYLSGRVFVGSIAAATPAAPATPPSKQIITSFNRLKASAARTGITDPSMSAAALTALLEDPVALLLNRRGLLRGERPVVVDTFLSKQLRAHQRDGVEFLYNCVMGVASQHYEGCILADGTRGIQRLRMLAPFVQSEACSRCFNVAHVRVSQKWDSAKPCRRSRFSTHCFTPVPRSPKAR